MQEMVVVTGDATMSGQCKTPVDTTTLIQAGVHSILHNPCPVIPFRCSLRPGQMRGRPLVNGKVMQWGIGAHLDRVNGSSCSYISPQRLDTPRGRYRNLLVTEGVQLPATTKRQ